MKQRGLTAPGCAAITLSTILSLGALSGSALADPSVEDKALATALFKEAREMLERNEIHIACRKFQESQRIDPSGGTLLNLAVCHERMGRTASAWTEFNEALAWARRDDRTDRIQFAATHMKALEPHLSHIIVEVPQSAQIEGLEIRRDGSVVRRAAWGSRMPVDPGKHVIEASAKDHRAWRSELSVEPNNAELRVVVPMLVPLAASAVHEGPVDDVVGPARDGRTKEVPTADPASTVWPAYVLGGVGVVSLGIGTYFGLQAFSKKSDADDECVDGCSSKGLRLDDEAGEAADTSTVAFAVGIVAIGAGVTVWLLGPDEPPPVSFFAPSVGPDHAGMSWNAKF